MLRTGSPQARIQEAEQIYEVAYGFPFSENQDRWVHPQLPALVAAWPDAGSARPALLTALGCALRDRQAVPELAPAVLAGWQREPAAWQELLLELAWQDALPAGAFARIAAAACAARDWRGPLAIAVEAGARDGPRLRTLLEELPRRRHKAACKLLAAKAFLPGELIPWLAEHCQSVDGARALVHAAQEAEAVPGLRALLTHVRTRPKPALKSWLRHMWKLSAAGEQASWQHLRPLLPLLAETLAGVRGAAREYGLCALAFGAGGCGEPDSLLAALRPDDALEDIEKCLASFETLPTRLRRLRQSLARLWHGQQR